MTDNALKAISRTDTELRVGNYIVLFGGRDLEGYGSPSVNPDGSKGEYFSPRTNLESKFTKAGALYVDWEHGQGELADELLGIVDWKTAKVDDKGVFVQRVLNRRSQYVQWVEELIEAGLVGTSSQAMPAGIQKAQDGEIQRWPLEGDTLSVQPMDFRNMKEFGENIVTAFKALGIPVPDNDTPEPVATPEAVRTAAVAVGASESTSEHKHQMEEPMSEEQTSTAPVVDVDAIVAAAVEKAAEAAVKAYRTKLEAEPPTTKAGLLAVEDEADRALKGNPYKTLGGFLMSVKDAAMGITDKRLRPLRSAYSEDEFGFSLNGAMGDGFVGGLVKSAFAKQTGLNEGGGAAGGFLVDTDRNNSIMQRVYNVGDVLQRVDMVGISAGSNGMTFNAVAENARTDGNRRGGILAYWTAEAGTKVPSHPTFRQLELRLHKCVGLVYSTDELLQDANALESWIMSNLPEELRFVVEDSIFGGTGVGMPFGIFPSPALIAEAIVPGQAAATIVGQNIMDMWSRLWPPSRKNAVWCIDQSCEPELYNMAMGVGTGGVALYQPPGGVAQTPNATLMGRPIITTEYQVALGTQGDIALIDFSEYQMIEKGGIQQATSIHVAFLTDETLFRFVYRVDGQPKWNAVLTPNSGGPTQSPYIVLAARP